MLKELILGFFLFILLDFIFLGIFAKKLYKKELGKLMKKKINYGLSLLVYALLSLGIFFFVLREGKILEIFLRGCIFGLVVYGVYDLTNYVTLANYSFKITLIDILWGILVCGIVSILVLLL
ncbi:DUF2177 family protein [Candidatus Pacearchaeota archaeon]|nr:DUF2177 family protein [Candidatus Pacearchaeota archaeon]